MELASPSTGSAMNVLRLLPHAMSISRIAMAAVIWWRPTETGWLIGWMAAAAISDMLDGWLARRLRGHEAAPRVEETGAWLDPLCDKVFVVSLLALLVHTAVLDVHSLVMLGTREWLVGPLVVASLMVRHRLRVQYRARPLGKATTVAQFLAVGSAMVLPRWLDAFVVASALLGTAAVVDYAWRAWRQWRGARS